MSRGFSRFVFTALPSLVQSVPSGAIVTFSDGSTIAEETVEPSPPPVQAPPPLSLLNRRMRRALLSPRGRATR